MLQWRQLHLLPQMDQKDQLSQPRQMGQQALGGRKGPLAQSPQLLQQDQRGHAPRGSLPLQLYQRDLPDQLHQRRQRDQTGQRGQQAQGRLIALRVLMTQRNLLDQLSLRALALQWPPPDPGCLMDQ
jgi:hypothetical protein